MASSTEIFDLGRLGLASGEGRRLDLIVDFPSLSLGGQRYGAADGCAVPVRLDVSRMTHGWSLRLRYELTLTGPCTRCLEDAARPMVVDSREIDQPGGDEDTT